MKIVVALGGNALLKRGEELSAENQQRNIEVACQQIVKIWENNQLIISHGNGPQVGLLALQGAAYKAVPTYPLDILSAQTAGMIGYLLQKELGNLLPPQTSVVTLLSQVEVDKDDPAFITPTKPIGPVYSESEAQKLAKENNWSVTQDNDKYRRVVASPKPKRILGLDAVHCLLEQGAVVICAGGGGMPNYYDKPFKLKGIEAVIDKDLCSALLAETISADLFIIATDVPAVYLNWGTAAQQAIKQITPEALAQFTFAAGSMQPKVQAAINFVMHTGKDAVIGPLSHIAEMVQGKAGTRISLTAQETVFY